MNPLTIFGIAIILGIRHATDADHVVAVSTIVSQQKRLVAASLIGLLWGIGHTVTISIVGIAIILFHVVIPTRLGLSFEFMVAVVLVILGILNLTGIMTKIVTRLSRGTSHAHLHFHDALVHVHVHKHTRPTNEEKSPKKRLTDIINTYGIFQLVRPLVIGLIHGLAGSAAIALLILGSISNPNIAILYLILFGVGTIIGMVIITTVIGLPIMATSKKFKSVDRWVTTASGFLSLVFGLYLAFQIGFVDGLFTTHPVWDPH